MSNKATAGPRAARILVADDSSVIRKAIEKKLQHEFNLVMAGDGEDAWDALLQGAARVLITDIEMPRLDGCALITRIRASEDPRLRDLPIIAMTGAEDEETKQRVLACGATDFLVKPIDPMQLLARVHALARLDIATHQLAESRAALIDQSTLDPLTGLSSRRYFQQSCEQNLAYAVRHAQSLAVIRMEIDGFKAIYRQHGDELVDRMLVWLSGIFSATCRREDTLARIGGAEFAVVAPATDQDKARALCRRLCDAVLAQPFVSGATQIPVTLSLGAVSLEESVAQSYEDLMLMAERRTRRARLAGGNRVVAAEEAGPCIVEALSVEAPEPVPSPAALPDQPVPALPEVVELSTLDFDLAAFTQDAVVVDMAAIPLPDSAAADDPSEFVGLDTALQRLANGQGDSIEPWLDSIVRRLLPLLEFYSDRREGVLAEDIANIKMRCLNQA